MRLKRNAKAMTATPSLRRALALHSGEPSPSLRFILPLSIWLDDEHMAALGDHICKHGSGWEKRKATKTLGGQLPPEHGVYMFVWAPAFDIHAESTTLGSRRVLYIGKTDRTTFRSRYISEYRNYITDEPEKLWDTNETSRKARLAKYLQVRPLEFWFTSIDSNDEIARIESKLIRIFNPPLNKQGGPRLQAGKKVPAF